MQSNHVIDSFKKDFWQFDEKCKMIINDEKIHVCAFIMTFLEDMSQQAANAEFLSHRAKWDCQSCLCQNVNQSKLNFDIIKENHYHHTTLSTQSQDNNIVAVIKQKKFFSNYELYSQ